MSKTVLTIDDSKTMRDMVAFTLKNAGFEVTEADNGQSGLERINGSSFDVIITDINMPVMDGITFTREARKRAETKTTPILILTTESGSSLKNDGRSAGATGWIVKPFNPEKLLQVVEKVCGR